MKILIIMDNVFPPIIRIEKEARTQLKAGHELFLLALGKRGMVDKEMVQGIHVIRRKPRNSFLRRTLNYYWFQITFRDSSWQRDIARILEEEAIEALEAHNLPMVKIALPLARKFNIPLIADLHENYPEGLKVWRTGVRGKVLSFLSPTWRWKQMEKACLSQVDRVITVIDEAREHYIKDCDVAPGKITVLMNVEDLDYFCSLPVEEMKKYSPYFNILYCGGFGVHRGIQTAIIAMPSILREIANARLVLIGNGANEEELRRLARKVGVAGEVEFCGWQPFSLLPSYIAASHVCLVPHIASGHTNSTIPHKLFQYMAMAKPVIVSSAKPLARIVKETKVGLVYPSNDANSLAEAIIKVYKDREFATSLGKAGRKAVEERYNWQQEVQKLTRLYQELGGNK